LIAMRAAVAHVHDRRAARCDVRRTEYNVLSTARSAFQVRCTGEHITGGGPISTKIFCRKSLEGKELLRSREEFYLLGILAISSFAQGTEFLRIQLRLELSPNLRGRDIRAMLSVENVGCPMRIREGNCNDIRK